MKAKNNSRKHSIPVINTGSVSLLMIFIVLCISMFAALSVSGALTEYRYSQKIAQHNQDYYTASDTAVKRLKDIDQLLHDIYLQDPEHYYDAVEKQLAMTASAETDFSSEEPSLSYEVPLGDAQALKVVLTLNPPGQMETGYYRITSWQEIPSSTWNGDDSLNLMTF